MDPKLKENLHKIAAFALPIGVMGLIGFAWIMSLNNYYRDSSIDWTFIIGYTICISNLLYLLKMNKSGSEVKKSEEEKRLLELEIEKEELKKNLEKIKK